MVVGALVGFGLVVMAHVYLFRRLTVLPGLAKKSTKRILAVTLSLLGLTLPLTEVLKRLSFNWLTSAVAMVEQTWLVILFITLVALLIGELVSGFGYAMPRYTNRIRMGACAAALGLVVIAFIQGIRQPVVTRLPLHVPGLPARINGLRLVQLTDLHLGTTLGEAWLNRVITHVEALKPDLIVITGDVIEDTFPGEMELLLPILKRLQAPLGVYAVTGNHEYLVGLEASLPLLEGAGFVVLRQRWVEVTPGLVIAGVDDLTVGHTTLQPGQQRDFIAPALTGRPPGTVILLSHSPRQVKEAARAGVSLFLSGHTHGGQVWPFSLFQRLIYGSPSGVSNVDGMHLVVSRGVGTWGPRMRLFKPGEIIEITLF